MSTILCMLEASLVWKFYKLYFIVRPMSSIHHVFHDNSLKNLDMYLLIFRQINNEIAVFTTS